MLKKSVFSLFLLLSAVSVSAAPIAKNTTWSGTVSLKEGVTVQRGATLTIAPGTTVRAENPDVGISIQGALRINGSAGAPVVLTGPKNWKGIDLTETGEADCRIDNARVENAENGISVIAGKLGVRKSEFRNCGYGIRLVRDARLQVEDSLFDKNQNGVANEMKSQAVIRRNRFLGQTGSAIIASHGSGGPVEGNLFDGNVQGIALLQNYQGQIAGNRFLKNKVGIFCNQTQNTPPVSDNAFDNNEIGIVNTSFAYPLIENNSFTGNGTAIRNDQFGSPKLSHNLFKNNKLAIYNNRKSNPTVEMNQIEMNDKALFCDYSSYPIVRNNNFVANRMAVELGIYQSADWEKRSGSKGIVQKEAEARNSRNPMLAQAPTEFRDYVDVSSNWWGDDNKTLATGAKNNHPFFFDRKDKEKVSYEGFGSGSYLLDEIRYSPPLSSPVNGAGPQRKK